MKDDQPRNVVHEIAALENYLDEYLKSAGLTFEQWIEMFGGGFYAQRNAVIVNLLKPLRPKRIFEFACAGGFLAKLILESIEGIEQYVCSNFSDRVVAYCEHQLAEFSNCRVKLIDANTMRSDDIMTEHLEQYDVILTTSFEHIEHDRTLIDQFPKNSYFAFCVAGFDDPEHFRIFASPEDIKKRYHDLLEIKSITIIGEHDQKFVALSRVRSSASRTYQRIKAKFRSRRLGRIVSL